MRGLFFCASVLVLTGCSISIGATSEESGDHIVTEDTLSTLFALKAPSTEVDVDCEATILTRDDGLVIPCTVTIDGREVPYERVTTPFSDEVWPVGHNVIPGVDLGPLVFDEIGEVVDCPEIQVLVVGEAAVCRTGSGEEVLTTFLDTAGTIDEIIPPGAAAVEPSAPGPLRGS